MSAVDTQVRRPAVIAADPDPAIGAVLAGLRWRVRHIDHRMLTAGSTRRDNGGGIRFHYVASGSAALRLHDGEPHVMHAGDFVMVPREGALDVAAVADATLLSGALTLDGLDPVAPAVLPPLLFTCGFRTTDPLFASLLEMMRHEASTVRAGRGEVIERLADVVASTAVRIWLERGCASVRDWLVPGSTPAPEGPSAALDPHLARALEAIHDDPGSAWSVAALARVARASRSQFAERFRAAVGETPARYVTRVRMDRAEEMLRAGASVTEVALRLGYDSDAGFSRAFRRRTGHSPSAWRRQAALAAA